MRTLPAHPAAKGQKRGLGNEYQRREQQGGNGRQDHTCWTESHAEGPGEYIFDWVGEYDEERGGHYGIGAIIATMRDGILCIEQNASEVTRIVTARISGPVVAKEMILLFFFSLVDSLILSIQQSPNIFSFSAYVYISVLTLRFRDCL